jgi:hypothetical protein
VAGRDDEDDQEGRQGRRRDVRGVAGGDLGAVTAHALRQWRAGHPDPDDDGDYRQVWVGTTLGGAGVIRGGLTPECAAAVTAVLEAPGEKAGPEDDRTGKQRFHDALQLACLLLSRACGSPRALPASGGRLHTNFVQVLVHYPHG